MQRFVDTNVPMYAAAAAHELREPCRKVPEAIRTGEIEAVIDTEVVQEILHRYGRMGLYGEGARMARDVPAMASVVYPVEREDAEQSVELFERLGSRGLRARDAVHAAVMLRRGIREIISADTHFDPVEGIRRIDPREFGAR